MNLKTVTLLKSIFLALVLFVGAPSAYALDLGQAKAQGLVGEKPSGYLGAVKGANGQVKKLIDSINAKRKAKYQQIAKKNGTSLQTVQSLAGQTAIKKTKAGQYIFQGGAWKKK